MEISINRREERREEKKRRRSRRILIDYFGNTLQVSSLGQISPHKSKGCERCTTKCHGPVWTWGLGSKASIKSGVVMLPVFWVFIIYLEV